MRNLTVLSCILIGTLILVSAAEAQRGQRGKQYNRNYDTSTVEKIEGKVVDITYPTGQKSDMEGMHLTVNTGSETIPVHLGPSWYMKQQDVAFQKGDQISVIGSRTKYQNRQVMVAARVIRGKMTLTLRDRNGYPQWRGWRRSATDN